MTHFRGGMAVLMLAAWPLGAGAQAPPTPPSGTTTPPAVTNAQTQVQLTPAQKTAIVEAIRQKGASVTAPTVPFRAAAGEMVPPSIELYALPDNAIAQAPEAKNLRYTMLESNIVLVDPLTMRVVEIIAK